MAGSVVGGNDVIGRCKSGAQWREMWRSGGTMWQKNDLDFRGTVRRCLAV
jgi:hypothetical protein